MKIGGNKKVIRYEPIIGLEIHVELNTKSKMFCGCSADYFGHEPNTHCCPVCLGLPGSLPVPNRKAIEYTVMVGLALNCKIPSLSKFDRKNYFYPDLPKGYQISQYDQPFCVNGWVDISTKSTPGVGKRVGASRRVRIKRVHLEEDTGKMIHTGGSTLIDFNRSGVPLMEIVTEPDLRSARETKLFLEKLQQVIRYLEVSDCDMEKGSMRCEPNVSLLQVKPERKNRFNLVLKELPDYKVEIKNINSFKFVEKAIDYEIRRQERISRRGRKIHQETRGFDPKKGVTSRQRGKEEASDYRYFPEPDIPPIRISKSEIQKLKNQIPELPNAKFKRFIKEYGLSEYDASILTVDCKIADWFEEATKAYIQTAYPKLTPKTKMKIKKTPYAKPIANWVMGELARWLSSLKKRIDEVPLLPASLAELLYLLDRQEISTTIAKEVFKEMIQTGQTPTDIITKKGLKRISDEKEIETLITEVLLDNKQAVSDYKRGKQEALMFLVGQVMSRVRGRADPKLVAKFLKSKLKQYK